jgi:hypothetical protein|uniref:Response regulatory domain-containing protein n=1 Tax=Desulfobacca acetoxidans TaxID=60893 RepID=A0A7C3Z2W1_9BACT
MVLKDFWEGYPDETDMADMEEAGLGEMSAVDLVLYYSEEVARRGRKIQEVLENDLPDVRLEVFTDFDELAAGLQRPEVNPAAVVLVVGSREELDEFLELRPILENTPVVLVLPDHTEATLALAEELNPHYIKPPGEDYVELASILDELLEERRVAAALGEPVAPDHSI